MTFLNHSRKADNGKVYVCNAVNSVGSVSTRVMLNINIENDISLPPPIISFGPQNQTLPLKSVASLPCDCESESCSISWYKDGIPIISKSNRINVSESGLLTITDLNKKEDTGFYTCVAASKTGKTSWSGYLKLESPTNPNIKFYRAPESSAFPGAPGLISPFTICNKFLNIFFLNTGKPQIIEKTDSSCTITWSPTTKLGASSILGYRVEFFGKNHTDSWQQVQNRITDTKLTVDGLIFGVTYYFIVRAENSHGVGQPSLISEPATIGFVSLYIFLFFDGLIK